MTPSRRDFLRTGGACAAHLALVTAGLGPGARRLFASVRAPVASEPWGSLEPVADGVWALVSTPLEDRTTLCNGGIVAGRAGVVVIEAFASPEGAAWMARRARELTGRWPDQVVVTHYHGDHTGGLAGFARDEGEPELWATEDTRDRTDATAAAGDTGPDAPLRQALARVELLPGDASSSLDLGGRTLALTPMAGHTASDVALSLEDPAVVFCGDLVWNGMFPNYVDARPSTLSASVARLFREAPDTVYVPGHGTLAARAGMTRYVGFLDHVEAVARRAHQRGQTAEEAATDFTVPTSLGAWFQFSADYPRRALDAWLRELSGGA